MKPNCLCVNKVTTELMPTLLVCRMNMEVLLHKFTLARLAKLASYTHLSIAFSQPQDSVCGYYDLDRDASTCTSSSVPVRYYPSENSF